MSRSLVREKVSIAAPIRQEIEGARAAQGHARLLRADVRIVELSARAVAEEIEHSNVYLALARSYALEGVAAPRPAPIDVPAFPQLSAEAQRLLQVVGRIGWAYLGSPDIGEAERRLVSEWLLPMLRAQWQGWRAQIATLPEGERTEHGCPSRAAIERAAAASVEGLVLLGFERAGVDASRARAWFAAGAA
jgi:hypothetical protein